MGQIDSPPPLPTNQATIRGTRIADQQNLADAVEDGDPAKLLKLIDGLCADGDWDGLVELKSRCRHAVDRGKQLWAVADNIEYRLALEAPGRWAGPMVFEGAGRFTLGPLPEVAAARHTWADLAPHLPKGPARAVTAQERVLRGEDLSRERDIDFLAVEAPLKLMEWEPVYALATYHADRAEFPPPDLPRLQQVALPEESPPPADDPASHDALNALVGAWTEESNGRADVSIVHGNALGAIRSLGPPHVRMREVGPELAMALMAWSGASGGAYGRRPGAAAGRYAAWWAAAAVTDLLEDWPVRPEHLGEAIGELNWFVWSDLVPPTGWALHLAIEDPAHDLAWAIAAVDAK